MIIPFLLGIWLGGVIVMFIALSDDPDVLNDISEHFGDTRLENAIIMTLALFLWPLWIWWEV